MTHPLVNYKKLAEFVATDQGGELRRALALGTVKITQDHIKGEHVARIEGPPELVQQALTEACLADDALDPNI